MIATSFESRFWDKVMVDRVGCWPWQGSVTRAGYGQLLDNNKKKYAHRTMWELRHGAIPKGMEVCHSCDTPACVNPDHLSLGSHAENMRQMSERNRATRKNSEKTHCPQGHPYSGDNVRTFRTATGTGRSCRACAREAFHVKLGRSRDYVRPPLTHCKNGHAFNVDTDYITPAGGRRCRICLNDAARRYSQKNGPRL